MKKTKQKKKQMPLTNENALEWFHLVNLCACKHKKDTVNSEMIFT